MDREHKRRPRRVPFTQEEIENIIAYRNRQRAVVLRKLKRSRSYKALNIFNVACFFAYSEILLCFFGPCRFESHVAENLIPKYGNSFQGNGRPIIGEIEIRSSEGASYRFVVDEFIDVPESGQKFYIGRDYLLNKPLKGRFHGSKETFRLFSANPVIFFCFFLITISLVIFVYDLNQNPFTLTGISVLNLLTLLGISFL